MQDKARHEKTRDDKARRRLAALKAALADAHRTLKLGLGFALWDGATVPADWPADGLRIRVADEGVFASLMRRPKLDTLIEAHVAGRVEIENGTIFDLAAARPE